MAVTAPLKEEQLNKATTERTLNTKISTIRSHLENNQIKIPMNNQFA